MMNMMKKMKNYFRENRHEIAMSLMVLNRDVNSYQGYLETRTAKER